MSTQRNSAKSISKHSAVLETELYEPVSSLPLFRAEMKVTANEVPFGRKRVDLVGLTRRGDLVAVEFKVSDWKRVLWQASVNQLFADYSYVAVWHPALKFLNLNLMTRKGLGLIVIDQEGARTVRRAARSRVVREVHRETVMAGLTNGLSEPGLQEVS